MSPDLLRQQLTMTSVAEGEEIEDGLPHRVTRLQSIQTSLVRIAHIT